MRKLFVLLLCAVALGASAHSARNLKKIWEASKVAVGATIIKGVSNYIKTNPYIKPYPGPRPTPQPIIRKKGIISKESKRALPELTRLPELQSRDLTKHLKSPSHFSEALHIIDSLKPDYVKIKQEIMNRPDSAASGDRALLNTYSPFHLLFFSAIANLNGERDFEYRLIREAVKRGLTMDCIEKYVKAYKSDNALFYPIESKARFLVQIVVQRDFVKRASFSSGETDSIRMPNDSLTYYMCDTFAPEIKPLAQLTFSPTFDTDIDLYKAVVDSIIAKKVYLLDDTENCLFSKLATNLYNNGEYDLLLTYFANEPLEKYAMQNADILLSLSEAAFFQGRDAEWQKYSQRLETAFPNHYELLCSDIYDTFFEYITIHPEDIESIRGIIDLYDDHLGIAYKFISDLTDSVLNINEIKDDWSWSTLDDLTPNTRPYVKTIVAISDYVKQKYPDDSLVSDYITMIGAQFGVMIDSHISQSESDIIIITEKWPADGIYEDNKANFCLLIGSSRAYIAGHGVDKPKDALKWLKKYEELAADPNLDSEIRSDYYSYMAECYGKLGKKKEQAKYARLAEQPDNADSE